MYNSNIREKKIVGAGEVITVIVFLSNYNYDNSRHSLYLLLSHLRQEKFLHCLYELDSGKRGLY